MKRAIIIVVSIAVVAIGGFLLTKKLQAASPAEKTQFKIAKAEVGMVKKTVSATGTLQPWKVVDIKSKAGGKIMRLGDTVKNTHVDVGSQVKKGDVIAEIDPTDTRLAFDQANADIKSANARIDSSSLTYRLQQSQSSLAVQTARINKLSAEAAFRSAVARLATAKHQMDAQPGLTKASVASAQANYDNTLRQLDELKNATQPQERASAKSALEQAQANLTNAEANLSRQRKLLDRGFVSQQVVDSALASRDVMKAQVDSAQRKMSTIDVEQKASLEAMKARVGQSEAQLNSANSAQVDVEIRKSAYNEALASRDQAKQQVNNATTSLNLAIANQANNEIRQTDIASAQAQRMRADASMTNARTTLDQTRVEAPSTGIILKKYVDEGTIISSALSFAAAGNSIVQLGDTTRMYVDVTVDETDIANVEDKQTVDVTVEAYPNSPIEGKVVRIDPQTEVIQNVTMVHVRVEIDNTAMVYQLLKPGMNTTCEFVMNKKDDVLSVPNEAVRSDDNGRYVEIAQGGTVYKAPDGKTDPDPNILVDVKPLKRVVKVGLEGNDLTEITEGLKVSDRVITQTVEPVQKQAGSPFQQQRMGGFGGRGGSSGGGGGRGGGR